MGLVESAGGGLMSFFVMLSESGSADVSSWKDFGSTTLLAGVIVWMATKAFPQLLKRHDDAQESARNHFEKILNDIEDSRSRAAREGHEAAQSLAKALQENSKAIHENSTTMNSLQHQMRSRPPQNN